jgi:hypothetical protein
VPGQRAEGAGQDAVEARERRQLRHLVHAHHPARQAEPVLQRDALGEGLDVGLGIEQEQVAHAREVHLPAGSLAEGGPRLERPHPDADVQLVREHRAHAAGALHRRAGAQVRAIEQQHVLDARLAEVKGDARADRPAAHYHERGSLHVVDTLRA